MGAVSASFPVMRRGVGAAAWWGVVENADGQEEGPAFIEFGADQMGEVQFGLTSGNIDYRLTERGGQPTVEWTWEGMDEMDPCTGRGWAVLEEDELHGMIFFHQGDESSFVAKRAKAPKRPKKRK